MTAILQITDGTTTVDLLRNFRLLEWIPSFHQYKQTPRENPLSNYERVADSVYNNNIETFSLKLRGDSADNVFDVMSTLNILLEDMSNFWVDDWGKTPVYLINQASHESNARYALIYDYNIPQYNNFYQTPFIQQNCERLFEFDLIVEIGEWLSNPPLSPVSLGITAYRNTSGRITSSTNIQKIFIANQDRSETISYAKKLLSAVYTDMLSETLPYLFTTNATTTTGDAWYFGDNKPFSSFVLDCGAYEIFELTISEPEYWDGATWSSIPSYLDKTILEHISADRRNTFTFIPPSDWTTTTVDGDSAYWIRFRVTAGLADRDTFVGEQIYIPTWNSVLIPEISGTQPALAEIDIATANAPYSSTTASFKTYINRIFTGLRGVSRGENFSAFINLGDDQNPSGISITNGSDSSTDADNTAPCGQRITYSSVTTDAWDTVATITLDDTILDEYVGEYRAFLRITQVGGSTSTVRLRIQSRINSSSSTYISPEFLVETTDEFAVVDFGKIAIPTISNLFDGTQAELVIQTYRTSATPNIYLYDLVLVPTDEWFADCIDQSNTTTSALLIDIFDLGFGNRGFANYLSIDSATQYKNTIVAPTRIGIKGIYFFDEEDLNDEKAIWSTISNGPCIILQQDQRLWTLAMRTTAAGTRLWLSRPEVIMNVRIKYHERYELGKQ